MYSTLCCGSCSTSILPGVKFAVARALIDDVIVRIFLSAKPNDSSTTAFHHSFHRWRRDAAPTPGPGHCAGADILRGSRRRRPPLLGAPAAVCGRALPPGPARHSAVQCRNQGFDGRDYQWRCETQLPAGVELGPVQVSCEGFLAADDPYVTSGSCGLEYELRSVAGGPHYQTATPPSQYFTAWHIALALGVLVIGFIFLYGLCSVFCPVQPMAVHDDDSDRQPTYTTDTGARHSGDQPRTVVVKKTKVVDRGGSFSDGFVCGQLLAPLSRRHSTSSWGSGGFGGSSSTKTSVGFGGTKRR